MSSKHIKPAWKDTTSYSRGDNTPRAWALELEELRITITKSHINNPGVWVVTCFALNIDCKAMRADTLERAKAEAVVMCQVKVEQLGRPLREYDRAVGLVHYLQHGVTLCDKPGVPGEWDGADRWCGQGEEANVTCPWCLLILKKNEPSS